MEVPLVEFAEILRHNGVKVSTAEVQDAAQAIALLGVDTRESLKSALACTLVKRERDHSTFTKAFDFYFSGAARALEAIDRSLLARIQEEGLLEGDDWEMLVAWLPRLLAGASTLFEATLEADRGKLAQLLRGAVLQLDLSQLQSPLQNGFFSRRLAAGAGIENARAEAAALAEELARRGLSEPGIEVVSRHLGAALRDVEEAARRELLRQSQARLRTGDGGLAQRSFQTLSPAEVRLAEAAVRKLAQRLKSRLMRRQRSRRRGSLNVRRTLRRNLPWGGVPMVPLFRQRRPERPDVIVLCDVSESVRNASRMMLLFTYTLQSLFARVRSLVFVSDLGEITEELRGARPDEAVDLLLASRAISLQANSNYGRALASFVTQHLGSVSHRTTVLVIGDGRNNYNAANVWALEELKRKAKRLLWICPEDRRNWGFGDSEMLHYERACHRVEVVQTLDDLERVGERLIPT